MDYCVIRSDRRSLCAQIDLDLKLVIRAPRGCSDREIESFVAKNEVKIKAAMERMQERLIKKQQLCCEAEDETELIKKANSYLPERVNYWSKVTGLVPSYVKITSAKKRYGSCNGNNGICFSYRLMMFPTEAIDYVIIHELAHIKHKNHSSLFYALIAKYMPDYKEKEKILRFE